MIHSVGNPLQIRIDGAPPSLLLSFKFDTKLYSETLKVYRNSNAVLTLKKFTLRGIKLSLLVSSETVSSDPTPGSYLERRS
jgi:hypothetical protein